jgi:hypothetical protein
MRFVVHTALIVVLTLTMARLVSAQRPAAAVEDFTQHTMQLAPEPSSDFNTSPTADVHITEARLIRDVETLVLDTLNNQGGTPSLVLGVLNRLKGISDKNLSQWPEASRFRYQLLDLTPLLVIKLAVRDRENVSYIWCTGPRLATSKHTLDTRWLRSPCV